MNLGTVLRNLRKSASDILPADTIFVNLDRTEEDLFSGMKPKTRYNIRLAERRGVRVREGSIGDLGIWMDLYSETAARNGIVSHGEDYFSVMFAPGEASARGAGNTTYSAWLRVRTRPTLCTVSCGSRPASAEPCFTAGDAGIIPWTGTGMNHSEFGK